MFVGSVGKDRKSTRLNSSHVSISYAVFCLKKKRYHLIFILSFLSFFFFLMLRHPLRFTLFPYTTLFRSTPSLFKNGISSIFFSCLNLGMNKFICLGRNCLIHLLNSI